MVYVDAGAISYGRMKMCHMMSDNLDELHAMADKIGIKRKWFQNDPTGTPHYDICQSKRREALIHGAQEMDRYKVVELIRFWRVAKKGTKVPLR